MRSPIGHIHPDPVGFEADRLRGRRAIVLGASSGIGAAAVRRFAREGASVVAAARRRDRLEQVCAEVRDGLPASAGPVLPVPCDVQDEESVAALVDAAVERLGGLDTAFNVQGVGNTPGPLHEVPTEEFDQVVAVNLRGTFLAMKHEIRAMLAGEGGSIVNTSSVAGLVGTPQLPAYGASKAGLDGLTRTAAITYADRGIRVNGLAPGATMTEMLTPWVTSDVIRQKVTETAPLPFLALPDDMARVAVFLLSEEARWITGTVLPVDGGATAD